MDKNLRSPRITGARLKETFEEVLKEALVNGEIDPRKLRPQGLHDVKKGPCSCGAWH